jgi:hypothetical protein
MKIIKPILLVTILGVLVYCTNPFDTRTPEEPDPGSGQPSTGNSLQNNHDSVLAKIKLAFNQKNPQLYQECFADPYKIGAVFLFTPEQDEASRLVNWTFDDEKIYFNNFVNSEELQKVELKDTIISSFETSLDTFKTEFIYEISAQFITKTDRYQGRSILGMLRASGDHLWYIYEWIDLREGRDQSDSTWSTLKANYR